MRGAVCVVLVSWVGVAHAQPAAPAPAEPVDPAWAYPIEVADRPQLLPFGVFQLDFSLDRSSYIQDVVDANGNTTKVVTSSGHTHDADLTLEVGVGTVEINARVVNDLAQLGAGVDIGFGVVSAAFQYYQQQSYRPYDYGQVISYSYRYVAIPKLLRLDASAAVRLEEYSLVSTADATIVPVSGSILSAGVGAAATVQLARRVALSAGGSVGGPVAYSAGLVSERGPELGAYAALQLCSHRWDLYLQGGADDVTRIALPYAAVGFLHRWF